jgi:hypothetical protein
VPITIKLEGQLSTLHFIPATKRRQEVAGVAFSAESHFTPNTLGTDKAFRLSIPTSASFKFYFGDEGPFVVFTPLVKIPRS